MRMQPDPLQSTCPRTVCLPVFKGKGRTVSANASSSRGFFLKEQHKKSCLDILLVIRVTHKVIESKHCFEGKTSLLNKEPYPAERIPF